MKLKLIAVFCLFMSFLNAQEVPEKPEDISPLLNGEKIPNATLLDFQGQDVNLNKLIKEKPTVLVFYRGGWCPYCNNQLSGLAEIENDILELGYQIIAVSPDHYKSLKNTEDKNRIGYSLLSDSDAEFIKAIGIGFKTPEGSKNYIFRKTDIEASEVLPVPTVMVLNTSGEILFEYINPNYKQRINEDLLIHALRALKYEL